MMILKFIILSFTIYLCNGKDIGENSCPDVKPVENFKMSEFHRDRWYEIARYQNQFENKKDCMYGQHTEENGLHKVKVHEVENGQVESYTTLISQDQSAGNIGVLNYNGRNMTEPEHVPVFTLKVLEIDYDKYAVLYNCIHDSETQKKREYAYVLSRTKQLSDESKVKVDNFLKSIEFIDTSKFFWDHFTDEICRED